jgi:hypothetical protein
MIDRSECVNDQRIDVTSCLLVKERLHTLHSVRIRNSRLEREKRSHNISNTNK